MKQKILALLGLLAAASACIGAAEVPGELPEIGAHVRIQAQGLAPGWHDGMFNRTRAEPPCHIVLIFKPRTSTSDPILVSASIPSLRISRLQISADPIQQPMPEWVGIPAQVSANSAWREIAIDLLRSEASRCGDRVE